MIVRCLYLFLFFQFLFVITDAQSSNNIVYRTSYATIEWSKHGDVWKINKISSLSGIKTFQHDVLTGSFGYLYSKEMPEKGRAGSSYNQSDGFPEPSFEYMVQEWGRVTDSVHLNRSGTYHEIFPKEVFLKGNSLHLIGEDSTALIEAVWETDAANTDAIKISITLKPKINGYFSLSTQDLMQIGERDIAWATVPGVFAGSRPEDDLIKSYAYGHGIPTIPIVVQEKTATLLAPILISKKGFGCAVLADSGYARDPWEYDKSTHKDWKLGLSVLSRKSAFSPTLYYPVLGGKESLLEKDHSVRFSYRFCLNEATDWFDMYRYLVNDLLRFNQNLTYKQPKQSLTERLYKLFDYVCNPALSLWKTVEYDSLQIGANQYLGGVLGSENDAMKNADCGAMWMVAHITKDSLLRSERLPYARNFKIAQQNKTAGFFHNALAGQYFLYKSKKFTEEWGNYSEPIGITYYLINDIGNMLLFAPNDTLLKNELRNAADKLLSWMGANGEWSVAYDHDTGQRLFTEFKDYRPTFYGLLTAYRLLEDEKYLSAAKKGADWLLQHAVRNNFYYGDCGDARFVQDFGTAQSAQAMLDLYNETREEKYLKAAIHIARFYCTSIYTHPSYSNKEKIVKTNIVKDWQISQTGLSFEHGGALGSATDRGPITLASHAGLFVRIFGITKDSIFLDMARAASWAREAFNDSNGVASYYWDSMNEGPGPFPHHGWWQIGWITDYLLSELNVRSEGNIDFPSGFFTPKVGPHKTYGFQAGKVFDDEAEFLMLQDVKVDNPAIECITAQNQKYLYLFFMNNSTKTQQFDWVFDPISSESKEKYRCWLVNQKGDTLAEFDKTANEASGLSIAQAGFLMVKIALDR